MNQKISSPGAEIDTVLIEAAGNNARQLVLETPSEDFLPTYRASLLSRHRSAEAAATASLEYLKNKLIKNPDHSLDLKYLEELIEREAKLRSRLKSIKESTEGTATDWGIGIHVPVIAVASTLVVVGLLVPPLLIPMHVTAFAIAGAAAVLTVIGYAVDWRKDAHANKLANQVGKEARGDFIKALADGKTVVEAITQAQENEAVSFNIKEKAPQSSVAAEDISDKPTHKAASSSLMQRFSFSSKVAKEHGAKLHNSL